MSLFENAPHLLFLALALLGTGGLVVFVWGHRLPGKGIWIIGLGLLALLSVLILTSGLISTVQIKERNWLAGWIWPSGEVGALTLGISTDSLGLSVGFLAMLLTTCVLLTRIYFSREGNSERVFSALAVSTVGVTLAWNSLTPWLALIGLIFTIVGGFVSYGSKWELSGEANVAVRFMRIRTTGFLLAFVGACILVTARPALLFNQPEMWATQSIPFESTWVGSILLVTGLFIQMLPFPFLGSVISHSEVDSPPRTLLTQIYPAWTSLALLIRLEPQLRHLGLFPGFGWVALLCSVLTLFTGFFQQELQVGLRVWYSAGLSLTVAMLAFSGPLSSFGMVLGISLGAYALSGVSFELQRENPAQKGKTQRRILSLKGIALLSVFAGTGGIGFVSATSGIRWMTLGMNTSGGIPFFCLAFFLFVSLGWKLGWTLLKMDGNQTVSWGSLISPLVGLFLSFALVWTGTVTGNVFLNFPDSIAPSLFEIFFGLTTIDTSNIQNFISASGLYWGTLILALATSYWISRQTGRKEDRWTSFTRNNPRLNGFLSSGYEIDRITKYSIHFVVRTGQSIESAIDQRVWADWVPVGLSRSVRFLGNGLSHLDSSITRGLARGLQGVVDGIARALQTLQNGDVRWYLVFVLGSSFTLLFYFLFLLKR